MKIGSHYARKGRWRSLSGRPRFLYSELESAMFTRGALLYIGQRLVLIVFTAVAVSSIVFLGGHPLPGDAPLNDRRPDPAPEAAPLPYYHLHLSLAQHYVRDPT